MNLKDKIIINGYEFHTAVAVTEDEHINGLMFKTKAFVMSFPYDTLAIRKFWMKNTQVPLDIIFCLNKKVINICYGKPYCEDFIGPNEPTDLVIEMPMGFAKQYNINSGDAVKLQCSRKTQLKKFLQSFSSPV